MVVATRGKTNISAGPRKGCCSMPDAPLRTWHRRLHSTPQESARYFRQTAESFRADPVGTLAHLASQVGLSPSHLVQEIAARSAQQIMQPQQQNCSNQT